MNEDDIYETPNGMDDVTFWQLCYIVALYKSRAVSDRAQPEHIAWDAVKDLQKFRELKNG